MKLGRGPRLILFCLLGASAALAGPRVAPVGLFQAEDGEDILRIGVRSWLSSGNGEWQISFAEEDPDIGTIAGRSLLEWEDLEADIPVVYGELRLTHWLSIGGSYGNGDVEGRNTDTDWLDVPAFEMDNFLLSESVADTDGETTVYDVNVYVRLNPKSYFPKTIGRLDFVAGYEQYTDELRDRNGVQTILLEEAMNEPFEGLDSTFDFTWDAFRFGLRGELPLQEWLLLKGEAAALVGVSYEGEAFWNLRDEYKATPPNFTQEADSGTGYDVRLAIEIRPVRYVAVEAGYWWFSVEVENGTETTYFADGTVTEEAVDRAESARDGFFVGVSAQF